MIVQPSVCGRRREHPSLAKATMTDCRSLCRQARTCRSAVRRKAKVGRDPKATFGTRRAAQRVVCCRSPRRGEQPLVAVADLLNSASVNRAKQIGDFDMHQTKSSIAHMAQELERGRESYKRRAWADAYQALSLADSMVPLAGDDLELLAMSACLIARDDAYLSALERAYKAHLDAGENVRAIRCAFWDSLRLLAWFAPSLQRRDGPRDRMARPRQTAHRVRRA